MVKDAPGIETVLEDFMKFIGDAVLVAHNAEFDVSFLKETAKRLGRPLQSSLSYLDTLGLSRVIFPKLSNYRLDTVAKELGIPLMNHHRAVHDAECTAEIMIAYLNRFAKKGLQTLQEVQQSFLYSDEAIRKLHSTHFVILVKNETGRVNLYKLCSESSLRYFHKRPLIPRTLLEKYREGLLIGSACSEGELFNAVLEGAAEEELARLVRFYDYLEVQPVGNNEYLLRDTHNDLKDVEELREINRKIVSLGDLFRKPVCATGDAHFTNPEDAIYREILQAGKGFEDADKQPPLYLRTTDEMLKEFDYLGAEKAYEIVVTNTNRIAGEIDYVSPVRKDTCPPVIENSDESLRAACYQKAHELYGDPLPKIVEDRLERELQSIIGHGYAVMYMIAEKLVSKSVSDGYLVGSRGSVGSSLAATMSGITEVNPLKPHYVCPACKYSEFDSPDVKAYEKYAGCDMPDKACPVCGTIMNKDGFNIPFETFLGFKGDKEPDIDLNFSGEYQSKAHAYTEVIFGKGQTFRAGTYGGIAEKTAYGYTMHFYEEQGIRKRSCEIERLSKKLVGIRRTTGQHPGGIVVLPFGEDINTFTPIQHPANDPTTPIITTSFEYHAIDKNLLKLDILGHDDPTMIRMLQELTGKDPTKFPLDSKEVMSLFESTEALGITPEDIRGCRLGALGIPEFGTDFAMNMVMACKPKHLSDLVRIAGMAHGTDVWSNNNQILFENGTVTLDTAICCRDDIMEYLIDMGLESSLAFNIMEKVRKGKGLTKEWETEMRAHGVPEWYIWSCNKIQYMFPKAHAAAYVMMAWRIAYCKVFYPLEYYCSYYTVRADGFNYEKMCMGEDRLIAYMEEFERLEAPSDKAKVEYRDMRIVQEMYARGFGFAPIDLETVKATEFQITADRKIMPALKSIEDLGESAADSIVEAVHDGKGPFTSQSNFRLRAKVSQTIVEKLVKLRILDGLPSDDQFSLFDSFQAGT
ncbi:MAG: PolC-type DNA polymerase III, partial [Lachnospiraceae bacterium]|nr:PolC-type DNA polymerase III [Lachnospiraceae bacterium]